jgi:hypothetical protein
MLLPTSARRRSAQGDRDVIATMARIPPKSVSKPTTPRRSKHLDRDLKRVVFGQDKAIDAARLGDQAGAAPACATGQADRLLPVLRPDRRRQDRGRAPARRLAHGHRAAALRHVRIHGAPLGQPADRRASGLCRLRPGRPADRRRRPASAQRAAARRDREGASGPVQHPAAGHGPRQADRPQRQEGRFPQRHPDHDHQCRRVRHGARGPSASAHQARGRGRGSDQADVHAGIPQPARCDRALLLSAARGRRRVVDKFILQLELQLADRNVTIELSTRRGELARRARLRQALRRAADGPGHPGEDQAAARRRIAVRQAGPASRRRRATRSAGPIIAGCSSRPGRSRR